MDIVKTNIERLGGSIEIDSEQNIGTTIRIKMPQTLSAAGMLIIKENGVLYGVPETSVEYIARVTSSNPARRLELTGGSLMLSFDGRVIPAVTLAAAEAKDKNAAPPDSKTLAGRLSARVNKCLVLKTGDRNFALLIEDAIAAAQTLVTPLPLYLRGCRCYSGVTVLGSGEAITILDAEGIKRLTGVESSPRFVAPEIKPERTVNQESGRVLVFKGSGEELFALDAGDIGRIERIDAQGIRKIGEKRFVDIAGREVLALRPEDYAPVQGGEYTAAKLYLVTLGVQSVSAGFLARKVLDIGEYNRQTVIYLDTAAILRSLLNKDGDEDESAKLLRGRRMVRRKRRGGEQGGA
jgi:two-component system chemotaxis sensor kinase CheA